MTDATAIRVRLVVRGRVQGVAFRAHAQAEAEVLGLAGWVRNLASGDVELCAEGPKDAVEAMVRWCRRGPPAARVVSLDRRDEAPAGDPPGFRVLPSR